MNKKHSLMLGLCGLTLAMVACQYDGLSDVSEESASVAVEPKAHEMDTTGSNGSLIALPSDTAQSDTVNAGVVAVPARPVEASSSSDSDEYSSSSQLYGSSSSLGKSSSSVASSSSSGTDESTIHCFLEATDKCYSTTDVGFENMTKSFCTNFLEGVVVSSCDPYQ